jgi:hypothetical protein
MRKVCNHGPKMIDERTPFSYRKCKGFISVASQLNCMMRTSYPFR